MSETPKEKKIIVDEDWKTRVEAEREALAKEQQEGRGGEAERPKAGAAGEMPPASFEMLVTTLATEAMVALGQIPHPATGQRAFHPPQARYFIDTLAVLEKKTEGNLTPQEKELLDGALNQLRLAFVTMQEAIAKAAQEETNG